MIVSVTPVTKKKSNEKNTNEILIRKAVIFCPGVHLNCQDDDHDSDYEIYFDDIEEDVAVNSGNGNETEKKENNEINSTVISLKDSKNDPNWDENYNKLRCEIENVTQHFNFSIYSIDRKKLLKNQDKSGGNDSMMSLDMVSKCVDFDENNCISNGDDLECEYDSDDSTNGTEAYLFVKIVKGDKEDDEMDGKEERSNEITAVFATMEEKINGSLVDWAFKLCEMNDLPNSLQAIDECQSSLKKMIKIIAQNRNDVHEDHSQEDHKNDNQDRIPKNNEHRFLMKVATILDSTRNEKILDILVSFLEIIGLSVTKDSYNLHFVTGKANFESLMLISDNFDIVDTILLKYSQNKLKTCFEFNRNVFNLAISRLGID